MHLFNFETACANQSKIKFYIKRMDLEREKNVTMEMFEHLLWNDIQRNFEFKVIISRWKIWLLP